MTNSKNNPKVVGVLAEQFPTRERQYSVTTVVMAYSLEDAARKARFAEPISITLIDFPEERGAVGFNTHERK